MQRLSLKEKQQKILPQSDQKLLKSREPMLADMTNDPLKPRVRSSGYGPKASTSAQAAATAGKLPSNQLSALKPIRTRQCDQSIPITTH